MLTESIRRIHEWCQQHNIASSYSAIEDLTAICGSDIEVVLELIASATPDRRKELLRELAVTNAFDYNAYVSITRGKITR